MKVALGLISRSHYYEEVWTASWHQHHPPPPIAPGVNFLRICFFFSLLDNIIMNRFRQKKRILIFF